MAIYDFDTLCASLAKWLHRDDLTDIIPDFITLAEEKMSADIDSKMMEVRVVSSADSQYILLPPDLLEMRRLVMLSDPSVVLQYVTPDQVSADFSLSLTGRPRVFTVIGGQIQLAPIPDAPYDVELTYKQRIPAVSGDAGHTTNWLLTNYPSVYLYGSLIQAQPYMVDDTRTQTFAALYATAVAAINSIEWYSGSTMRVRAR